jgi:hypothetical protein
MTGENEKKQSDPSACLTPSGRRDQSLLGSILRIANNDQIYCTTHNHASLRNLVKNQTSVI